MPQTSSDADEVDRYFFDRMMPESREGSKPTLQGAGMNAAPPFWDSSIYLLTGNRHALAASSMCLPLDYANISSPSASNASGGDSVSSTASEGDSRYFDIDNIDDCMTLTFTYSQYGSLRNHTIRCDVETVDIPLIDMRFREENCVYPKAMLPECEYPGNRREFERRYNELGWCIAYLNPHIQGQRGLIQRAVDSYRNSSQDPSMRSRRTRRFQENVPKRRRSTMSEVKSE